MAINDLSADGSPTGIAGAGLFDKEATAHASIEIAIGRTRWRGDSTLRRVPPDQFHRAGALCIGNETQATGTASVEL